MRKKELEVEIIGGASPLTKEEEKLISDFINASKKKALAKERIAQHGLSKKAGARTYIQR
jgi:hypothetical protein